MINWWNKKVSVNIRWYEMDIWINRPKGKQKLHKTLYPIVWQKQKKTFISISFIGKVCWIKKVQYFWKISAKRNNVFNNGKWEFQTIHKIISDDFYFPFWSQSEQLLWRRGVCICSVDDVNYSLSIINVQDCDMIRSNVVQ